MRTRISTLTGNGYTDEWVAEAERRGLPNVKTWVDSIKSVTEPNDSRDV